MNSVCFSECSDCMIITPKYDVTFKTDISELVNCTTLDSVDVIGNHSKLGNNITGLTMKQEGVTNVYSIPVFSFDSNTTVNYKYRVWKNGVVTSEILPNYTRALLINNDIVLNAQGFARTTNAVLPPAKSTVKFIVDFAGTNITPGNVSLKASGVSGWLTGANNNMKAMTLVPNTGGKVYSLTQDSVCDGVLYFNFVNDATDEKLDTLANNSCTINIAANTAVRKYTRTAAASTVYVKWASCSSGTTPAGFNSYVRDESFRMYPNPMTSSASIEVGEGLHDISIIDITGKVVRSYKNITGKLALHKGELSSGIYIVDVVSSDSHSNEKLRID